MRLVLAAALLLVLPAMPPAAATHVGPCTHEWFEIVAYALETGDVPTSAGYAGWCARGTVAWACDLVRCREIAA